MKKLIYKGKKNTILYNKQILIHTFKETFDLTSNDNDDLDWKIKDPTVIIVKNRNYINVYSDAIHPNINPEHIDFIYNKKLFSQVCLGDYVVEVKAFLDQNKKEYLIPLFKEFLSTCNLNNNYYEPWEEYNCVGCKRQTRPHYNEEFCTFCEYRLIDIKNKDLYFHDLDIDDYKFTPTQTKDGVYIKCKKLK